MRRISNVVVSVSIVSLLTLFAVAALSAPTENLTVIARQDYQRAKGRPLTETNTFNVLHPGTGYTLHLFNGGDHGQFSRAERPLVSINGREVPGLSNFNATVARLAFEISLNASNTLDVEVRGAPGSGLTIVIEGIEGTDSVLPVIYGTANPLPNVNGWNNSNVTVSFTCSDALSGIASCSGPSTVSNAGANQSVTGTAVDNAHNTASATVTVSLDKSSPSILANAAPGPNANGWNNSDVTVNFTCSDALSGIASCSGPSTVSNAGANQSVTGTAVDNALNTASATVKVSLDKSSPSILANAAPGPNSNGWNNSDVTVNFTCSDALSGIASCSGPSTLSNDGVNQSVTGTAVDNALNTASATVKVSLDKSSPSILASAAPAPNSNGWNNSDVTVSFTCTDTLSGIGSCSSPVTVVNTGAAQTVSGTGVDKAGNTAATSASVSLDKTAPTVSVVSTPTTASSSALTVTGTASDALSGLDGVTCNGTAASVSGTAFSCALNLSEGSNTINVVASDRAGNSASSSMNVTLTTFVPPPFGPTAVSWINFVGVATSDNSLTKTSTSSAWDAGADSMQVLRDGYGFVEFTATETDTARMAGLGVFDTSQNYTDLDYGILLRSDASLAIYESGVHRGDFGSYAAADRFRVEVRYGVIRYLRNGVLFFTSSVPVRYPLRVDTSLYTPGATLTDVRMGNFVWTDATGVRISGESFVKTGAAGWNAGAISTNTIESGDGYLEFTATETNTARIGGLANLVNGVAVSDVQFGVLLNSNATVEIVEAGTSRGVFGGYAPGDRFRVELVNGVIRYYRNAIQLYTSFQTPSYPLRADSALDTPGATLTDVSLEPIVWENTQGVYTDGVLLIKTYANGWTGAASSTYQLQSSDGYVEFTAIETNRRRGLGLKSVGAAQSLQQIDYAIVLNETGIIEVVELGNSRGLFGSYQNGDRFRIEIQNGVVRYRKNDVLMYSSAVSPAYPLHAEAAFYSTGATLFDVAMGDLVWMNSVNVNVAGRSLLKASALVAWNAGTVSTRTITSGYMEFTASEASTYRIAGLSNGDSNQNYTDIDFAILLRSDSSVAIYEAGILKGEVGSYVAGDRFRVEVQTGVVQYRKNGVLLYTSLVPAITPLRVDTSINGANATLFDIVLH